MKMKKFLIPVLAIAVAGFVGCEEDDHDHDHGDVTATIVFDEPMDNEVIPLADANNVHLHIEFTFDPEGHGYEVELKNETDGVTVQEWDRHSHNAQETFMADVDLSSFPGKEFHLEAKACFDHDCDEYKEEEIHFSIGQ